MDAPAGPVRVPFLSLRPGEDADALRAAVMRVIDRGWFILGPELAAFEAEFAAASGAGHAIGVNTGTDAIALLLRGLGIGPGDEVITAPLSAAYTALAVMMAGARPVFADIDPQRHTIAPDQVEAAITSRTAAIMPVHLYGQPADMLPLQKIAERHGLALVEDAAQAHLATCGGRPVGQFGAGAAFSFYPTKNLGALGDAGAITTDDSALADRLRRLRNGGQRARYQHDEFGVNSRLDEMQAAILRERLERLPAWTAQRRVLAARYRHGLAAARAALPAGPDAWDAVLRLPPECDPGHVYHLFVVRSSHRDALQAHLQADGVETLIHYPLPITRQPAMASEAPASCPEADRAATEVCSLPLYPSLPVEDVDHVVGSIAGFCHRATTGRRDA
ncbi:MAG: DegT/DnrJ/EryC1/StrS family aminotransferase [Acidobacteria bacterium]|nr:DegT/DnrJ/EryC1/StrS family aminotransferase [Acidobacteriota bacterium]